MPIQMTKNRSKVILAMLIAHKAIVYRVGNILLPIKK